MFRRSERDHFERLDRTGADARVLDSVGPRRHPRIRPAFDSWG